MSDSSRSQILYSPETVFNEVPATPAMSILRFTREQLRHRNATGASTEIRADRMRSDNFLLGVDVEGGIDFLMSATTYDTLLQAALCGTWTANVLKNGVVNRSFLVEKQFLDITQFFQFRGCVVNQFSLDITAHKEVTGSFNFMGGLSTRSATTVAAASPTAATTTPIITAGPQISGITANTNMTGQKTRSLKFTVNNNLRAHDHVESYYTDDFGRGVQDVTGSMEMYFKNGALYDQFLANTASAFSFVIADTSATPKTFTINFPNIKLSNVTAGEITGVDGDVMMTADFRALYDAGTSAHLVITRVP